MTLNEQVAKYKQYVEDIAKLWFDLLVAYNPNGIPIKREMTEEEEAEATDNGEITLTAEEKMIPDKIMPEELEKLRPEVKVDVSSNTQWSKNDEQTADDNLLANGHITFDEYVDLIPDGGILQKNLLQEIVKKRAMNPQPPLDENGQPMGGQTVPNNLPQEPQPPEPIE